MKKQSSLYSAGLLSAANMAIRIAGFIYRVWLTRNIGAEAMGIYQMAMPLISLALTAVSGGIPIAVSRACARYPDRAHSFTKSAARMEALITLPITVILVLFSAFFASLYGDIRTQLPMILLAPSVLFIGLKGAYEGFFLGHQDTRPSALSEMLDQGIRILFTVLLLQVLKPVNPVLAASIAAAGTTLGEMISFLTVIFSYGKAKIPAKAGGGKMLFHMAWPVTGGKLISSGIQSVTSMLIPPLLLASGLNRTQAATEFGTAMGMAFPVIFLPSTIFSGLTTVLIPALSRSSPKIAGEKIGSAMEVCSLLSFFFACVLTVCSPALGVLLYRQEAAGAYMQFIAPFSALIGLQLIASASLNGLGLQKRALLNQCIGNAIMLLLCFILTRNPRIRMYGYLIGYCANLCTVTALHVIACVRHTKMLFSLPRIFLCPLLCLGLSCSTTLLIIRTLPIMHLFGKLLCSLAISAGGFLLSACILGLHRSAIQYFRKASI